MDFNTYGIMRETINKEEAKGLLPFGFKIKLMPVEHMADGIAVLMLSTNDYKKYVETLNIKKDEPKG